MQKITKILYIILILWSTLVPIGCRNSAVEQQLTTIDSLLATDKLTDTEKELKQLRRSIMNESEQAKYNLLKFPTQINRWKNNSLSNFLCRLYFTRPQYNY